MGTSSSDVTTGYTSTAATDTTNAWAVGFIAFAAFMMLISGIFQGLEGLAAILRGSFFVIAPNYLYTVDVSTWGWIHLIVGIIVAAAGGAVLAGKTWGRIIGIA